MARGDALKRARRQARAEAATKYNPQQRVLVDALASARAEEQRAVRSAKGTSSALTAAIHRARKPLRQGYADAAKTAEAARGDLFGHLLAVGEPARPFAAAVAREQAGVTSRAAQERAGALGELTLRGVQAHEGRAAAIQNAHRTFSSDAGQVYRQLVGLSQDRGTFTAGQIESIQAAQRSVAAQNKRANLQAQTTRRGQDITARGQDISHRDRVASRREQRRKDAAKLGASVLAGTKKPRETQSSRNFKGTISDVQGLIHAGRKSNVSDHQIRANLMDGQNPSGKKYGRDAINAAFDLVALGYLSRPNRAALRRRGVRIPKGWRVKPANKYGQRSGTVRG